MDPLNLLIANFGPGPLLATVSHRLAINYFKGEFPTVRDDPDCQRGRTRCARMMFISTFCGGVIVFVLVVFLSRFGKHTWWHPEQPNPWIENEP